jgi:uncharacterized membrane protein YfcA
VITLAARAAGGELTSDVWSNLGYVLPAIVLGILCGTVLGRRVSPRMFDRFALALLAIMGIRLLLA